MSEVGIRQAFQTALSYHQSGQWVEAEAIYRQILDVVPDMPAALHLLGVLAHQTGQHEEAAVLLQRSLAANPHNAAAHSSFGEIQRTLGEWEQAQACFERALALNPKLAPAHHHLGTVRAHFNQLEEARQCFEHALRQQPDYVEAHSNLGAVLLQLHRVPEARAALERAVELQPDHPDANHSLGIVLGQLYRSDEARQCFQRVLDVRPDDAEAYSNLGTVLKDVGQIGAAVACCRRAVALEPAFPGMHSNLIYVLHFDPETGPSALRAECARWDQRHAAPLRGCLRPPANAPDPARRLRVGYVSPDFRNHPVSNFIAALFAAHDRVCFEVHGYSTLEQPDEGTRRLQGLVDVWSDVADLSDEALAERIRADEIDILVDLTLHSAKNRLPVFARQPAPVQVSWLGYAGTSGLEGIGYRITDAFIDPPEAESGGAGPHERPVRLPDSWCCYEPPVDSPPVRALPALASGGAGGVTFGSLNQFGKCNERVLRLWARVLAAVPGSRLLLHCHEPAAMPMAAAILAHEGIDGARLRFAPWLPKREYLRLYEQIDVGLDPFPHNGMTTTCEALWMGVPVITLPGVLPVSRTGLSLLSCVGLQRLAARDEAEYVHIAADLASDLPRLAALRSGLREQMRCSPLMDAPRFATHLEAAFRMMWHRWCTETRESASPSGG